MNKQTNKGNKSTNERTSAHSNGTTKPTDERGNQNTKQYKTNPRMDKQAHIETQQQDQLTNKETNHKQKQRQNQIHEWTNESTQKQNKTNWRTRKPRNKTRQNKFTKQTRKQTSTTFVPAMSRVSRVVTKRSRPREAWGRAYLLSPASAVPLSCRASSPSSSMRSITSCSMLSAQARDTGTFCSAASSEGSADCCCCRAGVTVIVGTRLLSSASPSILSREGWRESDVVLVGVGLVWVGASEPVREVK